jgi:hypothetical protein
LIVGDGLADQKGLPFRLVIIQWNDSRNGTLRSDRDSSRSRFNKQ